MNKKYKILWVLNVMSFSWLMVLISSECGISVFIRALFPAAIIHVTLMVCIAQLFEKKD